MACGDSSAKYVRSSWRRCELQIWSVKVVRKMQPVGSDRIGLDWIASLRFIYDVRLKNTPGNVKIIFIGVQSFFL